MKKHLLGHVSHIAIAMMKTAEAVQHGEPQQSTGANGMNETIGVAPA